MPGIEDIPRWWTISSLAALLAIAAVPPTVCILLDAGCGTFLAGGAIAWALSILVKRAIQFLASGGLHASSVSHAALQGLISAIVELAAAAAYFIAWPPASFLQVVSFGIGAGAAEAAFVLVLGIWIRAEPAQIQAWAEAAARSLCVRYTVPVERFTALVGHTAARGLVYVGLQRLPISGSIWLLVAVASFAGIDAIAVYGNERKWNWNDPTICRRAHSLFALISVLEAGCFVVAFHISGEARASAPGGLTMIGMWLQAAIVL
jgi:hypothetical protein